MTRAQDLRTRFTTDAPAAAAPPPAAAPRTDPVRQTVDLDPAVHDALGAWQLETALALGQSRRVSTQDTLTAMVEVLLADDRVSRAVRMRIERGGLAPVRARRRPERPEPPDVPELPDVPD